MSNTTPNPSQSFEELLDKSLKHLMVASIVQAEGADDDVVESNITHFTNHNLNFQEANQAITQAVKQLVEGIIGEDEVHVLMTFASTSEIVQSAQRKGTCDVRNKLRAEQRAALLKALGGSD